MATLDDKILGEKLHNYCSSSESEHEDSDDDICEEEQSKTTNTEEPEPPPPPPIHDGTTGNTGPKGVIKDWQRFKQLEIEKREEQEKERLALLQKLTLTCRSAIDEENDPEFADLLDDDFLLQYQKQRMQEMIARSNERPKFGSLIHLTSSEDFLDAINKEKNSTTVCVHIYENHLSNCRLMNQCLETLSQNCPSIKFCKITATLAGVSLKFKVKGLPALLVYKNGTLVGNYVALGQELGDDFCANDVENFLIENGMIADRSCVPGIIRTNQGNEDDSD